MPAAVAPAAARPGRRLRRREPAAAAAVPDSLHPLPDGFGPFAAPLPPFLLLEQLSSAHYPRGYPPRQGGILGEGLGSLIQRFPEVPRTEHEWPRLDDAHQPLVHERRDGSFRKRAAAENDVASDRGRRHSHPESRAADDSPLPRDRAQLLAHTTNELRASGREFAADDASAPPRLGYAEALLKGKALLRDHMGIAADGPHAAAGPIGRRRPPPAAAADAAAPGVDAAERTTTAPAGRCTAWRVSSGKSRAAASAPLLRPLYADAASAPTPRQPAPAADEPEPPSPAVPPARSASTRP